MKTLIIGDCHDYNPLWFIEIMAKKGIERFVALGDYDSPGLLERLLEIDMKKIVLIGNHDYHLVCEFEKPEDEQIVVDSSRLPVGREYERLMESWQKRTKAREYVKWAANTEEGRQKAMKVIEQVSGRRVCYVHGGLAGSLCFDDEDVSECNIPVLLWYRTESKSDAIKNFKEMKKQDISILFRAHDNDHLSYEIASSDIRKRRLKINYNKKISLADDKMYIFSIGDFAEKNRYAVFDDEKMSVELS